MKRYTKPQTSDISTRTPKSFGEECKQSLAHSSGRPNNSYSEWKRTTGNILFLSRDI